MSVAPGIAVAVAFCWLGMVLAISFMETPLKFRAPGVSIPIGLGIGRLVFRALNTAECALGLALIVTAVISAQTAPVVAAATACACVVVQLAAVRPGMSRRTDRVVAGEDLPRSRGHVAYVGLECLKVLALLAAGIGLLAA